MRTPSFHSFSAGPRSRRALLSGTALGCSLVLLGAAPAASAQDACGPLAPGGVVTCEATGSPYAAGVSYTGVTGATVNLAADATVDTFAINGIRVSGSGDIAVHAAPGSMVRTSRVAPGGDIGAIIVATDGDITISADAVEVSGLGVYGVRAHTTGGSVSVDVNRITAEGRAGGVVAAGDTVDVAVDQVDFRGSGSAIGVESVNGARVEVGSVTGSAGTGVEVGGRGDAVVRIGSATGDSMSVLGTQNNFAGDLAGSIGGVSLGDDGQVFDVNTAGSVDLSVDSVTGGRLGEVRGSSVSLEFGSVEARSGVLVDANGGTASVRGGTFNFTDPTAPGSQGEGGIVIQDSDDIRVEADAITTRANDTPALSLHTDNWEASQQTIGAIFVDVGSISTHGDGSAGVLAGAARGSAVDIALGDLQTAGNQSAGVRINITEPDEPGAPLEAAGVRVTADSIATAGYSSHGVAVSSVGGDGIVVEAGTISTAGETAHGVVIDSAEASSIHVDVGDIGTAGEESSGVRIRNGSEGQGQGAEVSVTTGHVATTGNLSHAIDVANAAGGLWIDAGLVSTSGDQAHGVALQASGPISVAAAGIATQGVGSGALTVEGTGTAEVEVVVEGTVTTAGDGATAVRINDAARADLNLGSVSTHGDNASGIVIGHGDGIPGATAVDLVVADVSTRGFNASAIGIYAAGPVSIVAGQVSTEGQASSGITVNSDEDISIRTAGVSTAQQGSQAIVATSLGGDVRIETGDIETTGAGSRGIEAQAGEGRSLVLTAGDVSTRDAAVIASIAGEGGVVQLALGDVTTIGRFAHGVSISNAGTSTISAGEIETSSDDAIGLLFNGGDLTATLGGIATQGARASGLSIDGDDVNIVVAGAIETAGAEAVGSRIRADGDVRFEAGRILTTGEAARGLVIDGAGEVRIVLDRVLASGAGSDGVIATGSDVILGVGQEIQASGTGARLVGTDTVTVDVANAAVVSGALAGLVLTSADGTRVNNAGTISSAGGLALDVGGGAATIVNSGTIVGRIDLTGNADRVDNSGIFRARGVSDFGGDADVFNNTGLVTLAEATVPTDATFANLEQFNNAGVVDLANGLAGDVMTFGGAFVSQSGGRVEMDLDLRPTGAVADQLVVGAIEGQIEVRLQVQGAGRLGDTGVALVRSGSTQAGDELTVRAIGGGFLDYATQYDATAGEYRLMAEAADQAFEPTKVASGAQTQWRRSADVVSARFDDLRDAAAMGLDRGDRAQLWGQVFSGSEAVEGRRMLDTGGGVPAAVDLSHDVDTRGVQFGADVGAPLAGGGLVVGLAASVGETELSFQANGDLATFKGAGLGGYAQWTRGPLAIGGLLKADVYEMDYEWRSADLEDQASGLTLGARVEAAWRASLGQGWAVEPQASLSWTDTDLTGIEGEAGRVGFGRTISVLGKGGLRLTRRIDLAGGGVVQPFLGLHRLREFEGGNASRIFLPGEIIDVADEAVGGWSQFTAGANFALGPVQGFVQAESLHGEIDGYAIRVGARLGW